MEYCCRWNGFRCRGDFLISEIFVRESLDRIEGSPGIRTGGSHLDLMTLSHTQRDDTINTFGIHRSVVGCEIADEHVLVRKFSCCLDKAGSRTRVQSQRIFYRQLKDKTILL